MLTRAALPPHSVRLPVLFRIQLTTRAVTNVVPGGSAAGSALGYRMLTLAGVRGADAGFGIWPAADAGEPPAGFDPWMALQAIGYPLKDRPAAVRAFHHRFRGIDTQELDAEDLRILHALTRTSNVSSTSPLRADDVKQDAQ